MKIAVAGWHYAHRTMTENVRFFLSHGFDVFSALGNDFAAVLRQPGEGERLAQALTEYNGLFTVHYGLPNPEKPEDVARFYENIENMAQWHAKTGRLYILSFDVWFKDILPEVAYVAKRFAGTGVQLAFEDFCLNETPDEVFEIAKIHPIHELLDAGHMNIRLFSKDGNNSAEAFSDAFDRIRLPIIETHIHNNRGLKDMHAPLLDPTLCAEKTGTFDTEAYLRMLQARGLTDIIVTVETMPFLYGNPGAYGDAVILNDLRYVRTLCQKLGIR